MTVQREYRYTVAKVRSVLPWRRYRWTLEQRLYIPAVDGSPDPRWDETYYLGSGYTATRGRAWTRVKTRKERRERLRTMVFDLYDLDDASQLAN